jgi:hypothetical protein
VIEHSPFPSNSWAIPLPLVHSHRQIFHKEGCRCPTDSVLISVPGLSDYDGLSFEAPWTNDSRQYADRIQESMDEEFYRIFARAKAAENYCKFAQDLWRVFHYCNLPLNKERTQVGTKVGRLLHPQVYNAINIDSLRWIEPGNYDRVYHTTKRQVNPIGEHCVYQLGHFGPEQVPPVLGVWGFPFDIRSHQGFKYLLHIISPVFDHSHASFLTQMLVHLMPCE